MCKCREEALPDAKILHYSWKNAMLRYLDSIQWPSNNSIIFAWTPRPQAVGVFLALLQSKIGGGGVEIKWKEKRMGNHQGSREQENPTKQKCFLCERGIQSWFFLPFQWTNNEHLIATQRDPGQSKAPQLTVLSNPSTTPSNKVLLQEHPLHQKPQCQQREWALTLRLYRSESHCDKWNLCYWQAAVPLKLWRVPNCVSKAGHHQPHYCQAFLHQSFWMGFIFWVTPSCTQNLGRLLHLPRACRTLPSEPRSSQNLVQVWACHVIWVDPYTVVSALRQTYH